jgi:hypothetical protein
MEGGALRRRGTSVGSLSSPLQSSNRWRVFDSRDVCEIAIIGWGLTPHTAPTIISKTCGISGLLTVCG